MQNDDPSGDVANLVTQAATLFDIHDNISRVIAELELPLEELQDNYDIKTSKTFKFDSMLRLFIYKEVCDFSQKELADRLENLVYPYQRFGFDRAPTQQAISWTKKRRFSLELRRFIGDVGEGIREAAREHDNVRSSLLMKPDPDPTEVTASGQPLHHYVDDHAPEIFSTMIDHVCAAFDTGRGANSTHKDERVWEHQIVMSLMDRAGTGAAYRSFNKFRSNALHNDTHTRAIKRLATPDDLQLTLEDYSDGDGSPPIWRLITDEVNKQFNQAASNVMEIIEPTGLFSGEIVAAIDTTDVEVKFDIWKDEDDIEPGDRRVVVNKETGETKVPKDDISELLRGRREKSGPSFKFEYATLTIVAENSPIVLAVEPVRHNSFWEGDDGDSVSWAEIVDRLMTQAAKLVDIDLVMADRAFDSHAVYHVLDQYHDVDYLIPKKKDSDDIDTDLSEIEENPDVISSIRTQSLHLRKDVPYIDRGSDPTVAEDNHSHDCMFMYVPAKNKEWSQIEVDDTPYTVFATNRVVGPALALDLSEKYSSRWDIENQYRMIKPLTPSIASTDDRMRYFGFAFSCLLYNLWRLADHSLKVLAKEVYDLVPGPDEKRLDPLFPLADFLTTSIVLIYTNGLDPPD